MYVWPQKPLHTVYETYILLSYLQYLTSYNILKNPYWLIKMKKKMWEVAQ